MTDQLELTINLGLAAERIKLRLSRAADDIVEIGRDLLVVRAAIGESFTDWIRDHFDMSKSTAYRFISVAERFPDSSQARTLSAVALYELASPSFPDEVRQEIIQRAEAGEEIPLAEIKRLRAEAAKVPVLTASVASLRSEKNALSDYLADLADDRAAAPNTITVVPDLAERQRQYDAFLVHWRSLPMDMREQFWAEHRTAFAARVIVETTVEEPHEVTTRQPTYSPNQAGPGSLSEGADPASATEPEIPLSLIRDPDLRESERQRRAA